MIRTRTVELDLTNELIYREIVMTGVSGRKIWETWEDFARVMKGPYFKIDRVMGKGFKLEDYDKAIAEIKAGVPGKMILYPEGVSKNEEC